MKSTVNAKTFMLATQLEYLNACIIATKITYVTSCTKPELQDFLAQRNCYVHCHSQPGLSGLLQNLLVANPTD